LLREQSIDLSAPCDLCYARWTKNDARKYGEAMRRNALVALLVCSIQREQQTHRFQIDIITPKPYLMAFRYP
jgi:hypothetical protein